MNALIKEKLTWFYQRKLAWGTVVIVLTQVLGMLPALDFLSPVTLKIVSFGLGVLLTIAKGTEMFFDQSAQLVEKEEPTGQDKQP